MAYENPDMQMPIIALKTIEEGSEVTKAICKYYLHGPTPEVNDHRYNNVVELEGEIGDLMAAVHGLVSKAGLDWDSIRVQALTKLALHRNMETINEVEFQAAKARVLRT